MKKQFAIVCAVFVLLLGALCSCNNNGHPSNSSGNNSHISNASGNDDLLGDTNNTDNLAKNIELHTTSTGEKYYSMLCVGNYLGTDMPNDIGNYYKEILERHFDKKYEYPHFHVAKYDLNIGKGYKHFHFWFGKINR